MEVTLKAKFSNPDTKSFLSNTGNNTLIECKPSDRVYSCGLPLSDSNHTNAKMWKGKNLLGKLLVSGRELSQDEIQQSHSGKTN